MSLAKWTATSSKCQKKIKWAIFWHVQSKPTKFKVGKCGSGFSLVDPKQIAQFTGLYWVSEKSSIT